MFDILIKKGVVVDGFRNKGEIKDIAIKEGKIVKIDRLKNEKAKIEINAGGLIVSPGFIEINTLADRDFSLIYRPQAENYLLQGVTTVIGGGCGASLFPLITGSLDLLYKWTDYKKININWQKAKDFFETLKNKGLAINFGGLISWANLRSDITNKEFRNLTKGEKEKLKFLIKKTLNEGALGVSFGLGYEDEKVVGTEEILEIAEIVKQFKGYISFNLRDETDGFLTSVYEILEAAKKGDISTEIYQLRVLGKENFKDFKEGLKLIEEINKEKELVNFDISPYEVIRRPLTTFLPDWAAIGGWSIFLKNIREKVIYQKLIEDLKKKRNLLNDLTISESKNRPIFVGKTIKELAQGFNLSPEETMIKVLAINDGFVSVFSKSISLENLELAIKSPYSFISANSGFYNLVNNNRPSSIIHPESFGAFIKFLKDFVIDKQFYSLEEGIYKLTGKVAQKIGLKNRGAIKTNYWADLVIFSPQKLNSLASFFNPHLPPSGIEAVIVNGKIAYRKGIFENTNLGQIIKRSF
ncbi:MAG: N-acyl-D-amino-acid deacylase family protein [Minisyncoccia bacterium]